MDEQVQPLRFAHSRGRLPGNGKMHENCRSLSAGERYSLPLMGFAQSGPFTGEIASPVIGLVPCLGWTLATMKGSLGGTPAAGFPTITCQRLLDASSAADMK